MKCPWYISAAAVRDYLRLTGRPAVEDGPDWDAAEEALIKSAIAIVSADKRPSRTHTGALIYVGGRPLRLRYVVSESLRDEGDLPQLVQVLPRSGNARR